MGLESYSAQHYRLYMLAGPAALCHLILGTPGIATMHTPLTCASAVLHRIKLST